MRRSSTKTVVSARVGKVVIPLLIALTACSSGSTADSNSDLEKRVSDLEAAVDELSSLIGRTSDETVEDSAPTEPENDADTSDSDSNSQSAGTRNNPIALGETADVGEGWTLRINSVQFDAKDFSSWNEFNDPPKSGFSYVVINITAGYTGPDAKSSDGIEVSAVGSSNVEIKNDSFAVPPEPIYELYVDVFAGGENSGNIVLEVPTDDLDSLVLYAKAFLSFDATEVFFALR